MISQPEMQNAVALVIVVLLCELAVTRINPLWKMRKYVSILLSILLWMSISMIAIDQPLWISLLVIYLGAINFVIVLRLANDKIEERKSRKLSQNSSIYTGAFLLMIFTLTSAGRQHVWVEIVVVFILFVTLVVAISKIIKSQAGKVDLSVKMDELPTVTLAIPSRNESYDLVQCLQKALKINYPKLEILVLDDCSGAEVNEIIKNFAHKGVIFLKGTPPAKYWLAKNWAYQQLLHNSNGDFIVYAGVDVRMEPDSILQIVNRVQQSKLEMLSVLPARVWQKTDWYLLLQSLRYHRIFSGINHIRSLPPPLSSCFVVEKEALVKSGGFNTCRNSIYPEKVIAKTTSRYGFIISNEEIGVKSVKSFRGQFSTAVRTYYPLAHMQPEKIALRTIVLIYAVWLAMSSLLALISENIVSLGLAVLLLGFLVHWVIGYAIGIKNILVWTCQLPLLILAEIFVMHYSMFKYEFTDVLWKGRNVCIPLLRYEHRLPKDLI